jgi:hypothetical protein
MTGDQSGRLPGESPEPARGAHEPPPSKPPYALIALVLAAIVAVVVAAVVLLGGDDDDASDAAAVAASPTAVQATAAPTQPPAATPTRPAATQTAAPTTAPTGRTIALDRLSSIVISDAERTRITGPGSFNQIRTNVTDTALPFSSSAPTGPFLAGQGAQALYNVWQATAVTESGIFNIADILLHFPSTQAAMATADHLSQVYQTVFQNGERLPGPPGWGGFCERGEVVGSSGQRTYWLFCGGQKDNLIVGVSIGAVRAIDIATVRPAVEAYFQRAATTLG